MRRESHTVCYVRYADFVVDQQVGRLLQTVRAYEVDWRHAVSFLHLTIQVHTAHTHLTRQLVHTEGRVVDMCLDGLNHLSEQLVIRAVNGCVVVVESHFCATQTAHHPFSDTHAVSHSSLEHEWVKWFVDEVVHIEVQTIYLGSVTTFAGQDDDRQVVCVRIASDALTQFNTIAYRHTDISDDSIRTLGQYLLPGTVAVIRNHDLVVFLQDVSYVFTQAGVVIYNQHRSYLLLACVFIRFFQLIICVVLLCQILLFLHKRFRGVSIVSCDQFVLTEVCASQWKLHDEFHTIRVYVVGRDGSVVQGHQFCGQVQSDTRTAGVDFLLIICLIESFEDVRQVLGVD